MDTTDYRILDLLQKDGRATQLEIARAIGLSQPATAERIRKLEERRASSPATRRAWTPPSSARTSPRSSA